MVRTVSVARMRELDRAAIEDYGIPALILMENAGAAAARELRAQASQEQLRRGALVIAGKGNNGGDGYVVARHLDNAGIPVTIAASGPPGSPEARTNHDACVALGLPVVGLDDPGRWPAAGCVVDALLGVGFGGPLRADAVAVVEAINARREEALVVALDVPSGLDADTGAPAVPTVRAALTVTFGAAKTGMVQPAAAPYVGRLVVADISLPRALLEAEG